MQTPSDATHLSRILELWDFGDAGATVVRMGLVRGEALDQGDEDFAAELATQEARAHGLQGNFEQAHSLLNDVELSLADRSATVRGRYLLERGRVLNSSGDAPASVPLFLEAWEVTRAAGDHYLAVDAAHMLGIVAPEAERLHWNGVAIEYAESCGDADARRWLGSLYNNTAWALHDSGDADAALTLFEKARVLREDAGDLERTLIARWSVARCLRTLGRNAEALAAQRQLAVDRAGAGLPPDGFVHEELAELLLLAGEEDEARRQFQLALPLLGEMDWMQDSEAERLERIERLASGR